MFYFHEYNSPAFFEAIQMELEEYSHELQFISEYPLSTEPLRIDVVIIKKSRDISIKKNIATIFRKENIVEYKSPDDYVSVKDFYLVYGYACLYLALNELGINDLTLTFVESRRPRELLLHLQSVRGYTVEEKWPGIYIVNGDILPIQIIDSRRLSAGENIWLKGLDNKLEASDIQRVTEEIARHGKAARIKAYLDIITRANTESLREVIKMRTKLTRDQVFVETGLAAEWEARGEEKKATDIAKNMIKKGFSPEQTAELSGLDITKIKSLSTSL